MIDRSIALEALGALCNGTVTSVQSKKDCVGGKSLSTARPVEPGLHIKNFICTVLDGDETCEVSKCNFQMLQNVLQNQGQAKSSGQLVQKSPLKSFNMDENEFFDRRFDYDFTSLKDTETYNRGGEVYERPSGWQRFGLKVLDKYGSNTWLGTQYRSTQSVPGEWPVSYHGTSKKGAEAIIGGHYKPGPGQAYGRGVYSTPYLCEAVHYAKTFISEKDGKTYMVILQNRINPEYRKKFNNDKYWLIPVPAHVSDEEELNIVTRAIRPYGLLLKQV